MRNTRNQLFLRNVNGDHMLYVSAREIEELADGGHVRRIYRRQHGKGHQLIGAQLTSAVNAPVPGMPTIKKSEVEMNAAAKIFPGNRSRTARLPERMRSAHVNPRTLLIEEEDFIERTEAKVALWPLIGDDKAVRVGPTADAAALELAHDLAMQQDCDRGYSLTRAT